VFKRESQKDGFGVNLIVASR